MKDRLVTARTYRARAEKLRSIAATLEEYRLRCVLSNLADEYQRMAQSVENQDSFSHSAEA
jgi:hypothetical protein